jgi:hypothetical protein
MEHLLPPLTRLFYLIYNLRQVPDHWLIAKTIPGYKNKGEPQNVESYLKIANLSSASNIFEKLLPKRILENQDQNKEDNTQVGQHGFRKIEVLLHYQLTWSRALDNDMYVLVSSLYLGSAFEFLNIKLLLKRLKQIVPLTQ